MQPTEHPKTSQYLAAGSPLLCFLHSCRKPFLGTCVHGNDGHFYCSHECAEEGEQAGLAKIEQFKPRRK